MPLDAGLLLNQRYRIDGLHKFGSNGAVYRAFDTNLGVRVAVKENLIAGPEAQRQFRGEAAFLASMHHPNIARGTDFFDAVDGQFIVMDFVEGEDLADWIGHESLPAHELLPMLGGIFDALTYIHSRKPPVIHRDVNPSNIILSSRSVSVLVDFGSAKALQPGSITDQRSDQYSLAATIYALLTRQAPADSLERAMNRETLTPARTLNPAVPGHVDAALERALAIKSEDRYPDIAGFRRALVDKS